MVSERVCKELYQWNAIIVDRLNWTAAFLEELSSPAKKRLADLYSFDFANFHEEEGFKFFPFGKEGLDT